MERTLFLLFLAYLLIVNVLGLIFMLLDKHYAKINHRRIPEARLMLIAALGGSVGSLAGMYAVRHKTRHPKFYLGIPAILAAQIALLIWIQKKFQII